MIEYTLTRSKRKTLALYIRDGKVEVRAPLKMPMKNIEKFISTKEKWINDKVKKTIEQAQQREDFTLSYGDTVVYRGDVYPIIAKAVNSIGFDGTGFYIPPGYSPEEIKQACVRIYRMLAKRDLNEKVNEFSTMMSVSPSTVKINSANTRWGSCSAKKSINFSWRLIMADDDVIDYVVVHELAHIIELNHSDKFWSVVENILPDYKIRQKRLRDLQKRLNCEDWK